MTHADTLTYTGNASDLKLIPAWVPGMSNDLYPGTRANPSGSGNTIIIDYDPAATGMANPGYVSGGLSQTEASCNTVILRNGYVRFNVNGGEVYSTGTDSSTANYNTVIINGGSVSSVNGGYANSTGGTGNATANYNTVNITGGTIRNTVYGGYASSTGGTRTATHNTVTIGQNARLANITGIYGGRGMSMGDSFTGNTLNIAGQHTVGSIYSFEHLNFTLSNSMGNGDTLVTADVVNLNMGAPAPGTASTIGRIDIASGGTPLAAGSTVTLIEATTAWNSGSIANSTATGMKGMSLLYEWEIDTSGITPGSASTLKATARSFRLNPQTHALLSGRSAQGALLNQGADLATGRGIANMKASVKAGNQSFLAMQGGSSRYKTGSGIDMDSFAFMGGAVWGTKLNASTDTAFGLFFETGSGSYNSSNSFTNMASVRGSGNTHYIGAGLLGSLEWANGLYTDASLRFGRVESDLSTSVVNYGQRGSYDDTTSLYIGAHLGLGYIWQMTRADVLDVYTRYVWTHTNSDDVRVLGDKYHFDSADSHRWRTGMKYGHTIGNFTPYAGLAYEFEFDGKAGGRVHGYNLKETDMGGSTFVGELGLTWVPASMRNASLDLALEGLAGERDGFMGNVRFNYRF
ncbi:autotransporter outer membrane beta-barrel domain-containing protein [Oxalobacter vibrioformis]|uniref:Autotransporter outer membrane beta-barrel domain-containing protein n=1 Tax=Oxalobacter vibrioformis TaxID=933080 RepID=A0A9E9P4C5_9BURK|nr:autotransporter domain-containing protein [Oxalobacter vibrioformis]WAW09946.1 autotransporter outer membrane beta-barrel domain-containing protein [Oxalobacter vibrioformis]